VGSQKTAYHQRKGTHNRMVNLIPNPAFVNPSEGQFRLPTSIHLGTDLSNKELKQLAYYLASQLQASVNIHNIDTMTDRMETIVFNLLDKTELGEEGYELSVTSDRIEFFAYRPAGLFYAIQTLLQLIPALQNEPIDIPTVFIRDTPRFAWRGAMLDVARHFFSVDDVKRYIDLIAHYKMNRLHLHLTDDQGWRIEIKSWPNLTTIGSQTQVGGNGGGFYTQEQFKEIVEYANSRFVMIIPEIDTPGHTNAALASCPELNMSEEAADLYEGTEVGFSTLSVNYAITYQFLDDVIGELAEMTPGPYIHIGGDEAKSTTAEDYKIFIKRIQEIVTSHGKQTIGWAEIGDAEVLPGTIAQHWVGTAYQEANAQGAKIILSPANKTYLDMKYDASFPLGLDWAGLISVKDCYDWEPGSYMDQLDESDILGIEAPIWTETLRTIKDIEQMAFPRLPGLAELAWSPMVRTWDEYRKILAAHGKHMQALGINFFKSPDVEWE
jgi:hexosaminidase